MRAMKQTNMASLRRKETWNRSCLDGLYGKLALSGWCVGDRPHGLSMGSDCWPEPYQENMEKTRRDGVASKENGRWSLLNGGRQSNPPLKYRAARRARCARHPSDGTERRANLTIWENRWDSLLPSTCSPVVKVGARHRLWIGSLARAPRVKPHLFPAHHSSSVLLISSRPTCQEPSTSSSRKARRS
jgi:hypothetical protein